MTVRRIPGDVFALTAALAVAAAIEKRAWTGWTSSTADYLAGAALLAAALVAHRSRPGERLSALFAIAGATWFAGTLWEPLLYVHRGALAHVLLAYPSGKTQSRAATAAVAVSYAVALSTRTATDDRLTVAVGLLVITTAGWRYARGTGSERRGRLAALVAAGLIEGTLITITALRLHGDQASTGQLLVFDMAVVIATVGLALGLVRGGWSRSTATGLVVDLGDASDTVALRDALARALGDPSLSVGFRRGDVFVDEHGRTLTTPAPGDGRVATPVDGEAVIVHDGVVTRHPALLATAVAVARVAIANASLQREIAARVLETEASSRRIVAAEDQQRRLLGRELQEGAVARLRSIAEDHEGLPAEIVAEVEESILELQGLALGLHPDGLRRGGLALALTELEARAALPIVLSITAGLLPDPIELAAYFVCAEAVTNAAKHADASKVDVVVSQREGDLVVVITDDGRGGASVDGAGGLRGVADRVAALGGSFELASPADAGTRLTVTLPVNRPGATA